MRSPCGSWFKQVRELAAAVVSRRDPIKWVEDYLFHDIDYVIFPTRSALGWNFEGLQRLCNFYILIDSAR